MSRLLSIFSSRCKTEPSVQSPQVKPIAAGEQSEPIVTSEHIEVTADGEQSVSPVASEQVDLDDGCYMKWADIDQCSADWREADGAPGSSFDRWRGKFLPLPEWFDDHLDPFSEAYVAQMDRVWGSMVDEQRPYDPAVHEISCETQVDPVYRPGLYCAPANAAGDHLIAMGQIVKHSGIVPGSRVLEFGAGFAQNAVTFARMGCEVHTVDIDETFCTAVRKQAEHLRLNLTPHLETFGFNPGGKFDVVLFYECFHHARNWQWLIGQLKSILAPGGRVMMAGEPVSVHDADPLWCPYPWGVRLEAETAAITRFRKWYELGFRHDFLQQAFERQGFSYRFHPGHISSYADLHVFELAGDEDRTGL